MKDAKEGKIDIVAEVKKLRLPRSEYVVFGSGMLGALGIREMEDVDLLVTAELFAQLLSQGWVLEEVDIEGRTRQKLVLGIIEAFKDFWYDGKDVDVTALIACAHLVDGVPFLSLEETKRIKKAFGRPKDMADIVLIEEYRKQQGI